MVARHEAAKFPTAGAPELYVLAHVFGAMDGGYEVSMKLRKPADRVTICWAVSLSTRIIGLQQSGQFQVEAVGEVAVMSGLRAGG